MKKYDDLTEQEKADAVDYVKKNITLDFTGIPTDVSEGIIARYAESARYVEPDERIFDINEKEIVSPVGLGIISGIVRTKSTGPK